MLRTAGARLLLARTCATGWRHETGGLSLSLESGEGTMERGREGDKGEREGTRGGGEKGRRQGEGLRRRGRRGRRG